MSPAILTRGSLVVDDELKEQAITAINDLGDERIVELKLVTATGHEFLVGASASKLVFDVLARVAQGGSLSIHTAPEILTTSAAADILGVSRTTVMKLIRSGELPYEMAGSHHRVRHTDVMRIKAKRDEEQRAAIEQLLELQDP